MKIWTKENIIEDEAWKQKLTKTEKLFVALFKKWNWKAKDRHPVSIFRSLQNPNDLDLESQLYNIDRYLIECITEGKTSKIYRSFDWPTSIQMWLNRTKGSSLSRDELIKPIELEEEVEEDDDLGKVVFEEWELQEEYKEAFWKNETIPYNHLEVFDDYWSLLCRGLPKSEQLPQNAFLGYFTGVPWNNRKLRLTKRLITIKNETSVEEGEEFIKFLVNKRAYHPARLACEIFRTEYSLNPDAEDLNCYSEDPDAENQYKPKAAVNIKTDPKIEDPFVSLRELRSLFRNHKGMDHAP